MTLKLSDFAQDLLLCIFSLCSQSDLVTLSQVSSTFQQAAEYLLYRDIYLSVDLDLSITLESFVLKHLFWVITSNPQKVALIRSLHFQLQRTGTGYITKSQNRAPEIHLLTAGHFTDALRNAHNLVDLRVAFNPNLDVSEEKLDVAIKSGYFQLHTLYCNYLRDLEGIIASQKHLRLLGIDYSQDYDFFKFSEPIKDLCHSQIDSKREYPDIFMFRTNEPFSGQVSQLILFPELRRPRQAFTLCRDIVTSLRRDLSKNYNLRAECKFIIHIFDFTHAKAATICEVVEGMAQYAVGCEDLTLWLETGAEQGTVLKPWRIPGFLTSLSRLKQLQRLAFCLPGEDSLLQAATDLRSFLLEDLILACPMLNQVFVKNYSKIAFFSSRSSSWELETRNSGGRSRYFHPYMWNW